MASTAISSVGTQFKRSDGATSPTFTAIAEITGISGPSKSRETIDVTNLDSADGYREFIASFKDGGTVSLSMNYTDAGYIAMDADFDSDTAVDYQIVLNNGAILDFLGLVTEQPLELETGSQVTMNVTIKVSGKATYTPVP